MTLSHCSLSVVALAALSMFKCGSTGAADQEAVKKISPCAQMQGVYISGIQGCSVYRHYRDAILDPDLPVKLKLPDDSERSWVITVLGLTMFSEARQENEHSVAAVAASILNRAGYGKPGFKIDRIAEAAANNDFSQWLVTSEIVAGQRVTWIETDLALQHRLTDDNLATERTANTKLLKDPIGYAADHDEQHSKGYPPQHYPQKLARSIELARCIAERAEGSDAAPDLAWVHEFGVLFVAPGHVLEDKTDTGPCHTHSGYMSPTGHSYCATPSSAQGVCSNKPSTGPTACGGGAFSTAQHYQLSSVHSEDDIKKLDAQIGAFLSVCPGKWGT
jgi:hypothetical protein